MNSTLCRRRYVSSLVVIPACAAMLITRLVQQMLLARSLVVSLWMVDDSATARLMGRFYEELKAGQPVNRALTTAEQTAGIAVADACGHARTHARHGSTRHVAGKARPGAHRQGERC